MQHITGQLDNRVRHGGAEQQALPVVGNQCENLANVTDEAHVEHAVGLVEDEELDVGQIDMALTDHVEQTAGCGGEDVDATAQVLLLRALADATEHDHAADVEVARVLLDVVVNLGSQFTGRAHHQRANLSGA